MAVRVFDAVFGGGGGVAADARYRAVVVCSERSRPEIAVRSCVSPLGRPRC